MTFALHWRRDGNPAAHDVVDRLALGITRLRGDAVERWQRGPLALWHVADDPWFSVAEHPAGFVAIVAGRLDSFPQLTRTLGGAAAVGPDPTDAQLLAAAYERWGRACLPRLLGDFVAVVWEPHDRSLLCARDRVGGAPLYYWEGDDEVVVAGHLGGVVAHSAVPVAPNPGFVAEVLSFDVRSRTETLYGDVWRVPGGHARVFSTRGGYTWNHAPEFSLHVLRQSPAEAEERYRDLVTTAIMDRTRRAASVGTELSGGLDSSTVASLAGPAVLERFGEPLRSYSLTFPGRDCDESRYIQDVAGMAGLRSTAIPCPPLDPEGWRAEVAATRDLPLTPNAVVWGAIKEAARRDGVRVLLTGQGGDQKFAASSRYRLELTLRGRFTAALKAARAREPELSTRDLLTWRLLRPAAAHLVRSVNPSFRPPRPAPWISPSLAHEAHLWHRITPRTRPVSTAREWRALGYQWGWEAHIHDVMGVFDALTGVRYAHPFHDARLQQFALQLDESLHRDPDGTSRALQRRAMADRLPQSVLGRRDKAVFGHLAAEAFEHAGGRAFFSNLRIARECEWVLTEHVLRLYYTYHENLRAGRGPAGIWPLLMVLGVERWYEILSPA